MYFYMENVVVWIRIVLRVSYSWSPVLRWVCMFLSSWCTTYHSNRKVTKLHLMCFLHLSVAPLCTTGCLEQMMLHSTSFNAGVTDIVLPLLLHLLLYVYVYECMGLLSACMPTLCVWLVSREAWRGHQIPWDWSYRQLWAIVWMLGIECGSSKKSDCSLSPAPPPPQSW